MKGSLNAARIGWGSVERSPSCGLPSPSERKKSCSGNLVSLDRRRSGALPQLDGIAASDGARWGGVAAFVTKRQFIQALARNYGGIDRTIRSSCDRAMPIICTPIDPPSTRAW